MAKATEAQLSRRELAAWRGLLRTHARVLAELDAELEPAHGLAVPEYEVLLVLTQNGDKHLRMSELADAALLTRSGMTRLVDRLERQGLVRRERCAADGRGTYAVITPEGAARFARPGRRTSRASGGCSSARSRRRISARWPTRSTPCSANAP